MGGTRQPVPKPRAPRAADCERGKRAQQGRAGGGLVAEAAGMAAVGARARAWLAAAHRKVPSEGAGLMVYSRPSMRVNSTMAPAWCAAPSSTGT